MWAVEAKKLGNRPEYWYMSGLTEKEAYDRFMKLKEQGWSTVKFWDRGKELENDIRSF